MFRFDNANMSRTKSLTRIITVYSCIYPFVSGCTYIIKLYISVTNQYQLMLTKKEATLCLSCNSAVKGRADKKFCNDYCRNEYNNGLKSGTTNLVRNINNALGKNRRVLETVITNNQETGKTNAEKLLAKGFQFKYYTHTYTNKKGDVYYFCYDMGYLPLENDWFLIVKRKEETD